MHEIVSCVCRVLNSRRMRVVDLEPLVRVSCLERHTVTAKNPRIIVSQYTPLFRDSYTNGSVSQGHLTNWSKPTAEQQRLRLYEHFNYRLPLFQVSIFVSEFLVNPTEVTSLFVNSSRFFCFTSKCILIWGLKLVCIINILQENLIFLPVIMSHGLSLIHI